MRMLPPPASLVAEPTATPLACWRFFRGGDRLPASTPAAVGAGTRNGVADLGSVAGARAAPMASRRSASRPRPVRGPIICDGGRVGRGSSAPAIHSPSMVRTLWPKLSLHSRPGSESLSQDRRSLLVTLSRVDGRLPLTGVFLAGRCLRRGSSITSRPHEKGRHTAYEIGHRCLPQHRARQSPGQTRALLRGHSQVTAAALQAGTSAKSKDGVR